MTDNTEPTIDELLKILDEEYGQECNYDALMRIEALISDQVAKARGCTSCGKLTCDNCERLWQT